MRVRKDESDPWMWGYISLMLIVLTFFAAISALGTVSKERVKLALKSFREIMGMGEEELVRIEEQRQKIIESLKSYYPEIEVRVTSEGIIVDAKETILFDIGRAELKPSAYPILEKVAHLAKQIGPSEIEVAGFTCDLPINTVEFPSNWELSVARALSVVKYLKVNWLPDMNICATGNGEYKPKVPNISEENRRLNRRVEIYLRYGRKR